MLMKYFFVLLLLLTGESSFAQNNISINGRVYDSAAHETIEYATVTVTDKSSGKVVNGAITGKKGDFEVSGLPSGSYMLAIEFLGYKKKLIDNIDVKTNSHINLNAIFLSAVGNTLKDVTITAGAPVIENKIDKIVFNAANDITSQSGTALDVLKKVPQVNVDIDGNVELQGNSDIRFLINGKPSSVFGNSVADALAVIPASQIKSIEVITSPGAKYDAQGTGGIINIILKDNRMQGINGSINFSGGTRLENGAANLNMRKGNFGANVYFSGNAQLVTRTPFTQNRTSLDSATKKMDSLLQNGYSDFSRGGYQSGLGFDWNISKRDNITASFSYNHFGTLNQSVTNVRQDTAGNTSNAYNKFETNSYDWSLNYKKTFSQENRELNILYNASYGNPNTYYQQQSTYLLATSPYAGTTSNNPGTNKENDISIDYTYPLSENFTLETGLKTEFQNITSTAQVSTFMPVINEYQPDPGQTYALKYDMQVYAAYLSTSFKITKKLKAKTGLRYEYTQVQIIPDTTTPPYGIWAPSMVLSYDLNNGQFLKLSYTRRIERADYRDVNPFLNLADPYNITTGNPQLKPEIGNNCELGYNKSLGKNGNIYIALIERINTQDHKPVTLFYQSYKAGDTTYSNVSVTNWQNIGMEYNSGINASASYTIKDKLTFRSNAFLMHRYIVSSLPGANGVTGVRFRINLNASYQFPHNLITEAFGNYNSPVNNIQGRSPQSLTYTFAFRKQFHDKKLSVGLTATNIFSTYIRQVTTITTPDYTSYYLRQLPYRSIGISFMYKFGKMELKKSKDEDNYMNNPPVMGNGG